MLLFFTSKAFQCSTKPGWLSTEIRARKDGILSRDLVFCLLTECSKWKDAESGRFLQSSMLHSGLESVAYFADNLIRIFATCRSVVEASQAFAKVAEPTPYTWNAIISTHAKHGNCDLALKLYERMQHVCIKPNKFTFLGILKACSNIEHGKHIHQQIAETDLQSDIKLGSALVNMYAKSGNLDEAYRVLNLLPNLEVVSWSAMISGYVQCGKGFLALDCFGKMQNLGIHPDKVAFASILNACGSIGAIDKGKYIHEWVIEKGLQFDVVVGSTLVGMYAKCGDLKVARAIFDRMPTRDTVTWGAMIAGYVQHNEGLHALECFEKMQIQGTKPQEIIFVSILKACGGIGAIESGKCIHEQVLQNGLQFNVVIGSSLISMYAKCGYLEAARKVFQSLPTSNVVPWNVLITGYVQCGKGLLALDCFHEMQSQGINPGKVTFISILKVCRDIGSIKHGKSIHEQIIKYNLQTDLLVANALIDMYAKCGNVNKAWNIFGTLPSRDVVLWNAMIGGYAQHGNACLAVLCFASMLSSDIAPDSVTFIGLLSACSCVGLVDEGHQYFNSLSTFRGLKPNVHHITCMVDLLGHGGCFREAEHLMQDALEPNIFGWTALLDACRVHDNVQLGMHCSEVVMHLDSSCDAAYVPISNIYSTASMQNIL